MQWLLNGRQRQAVAQVLRQPLTVAQIWQLARELTPKIQLRDASRILRQLAQRGLLQCLNPSLPTGRVYYWTEAGRVSAMTALNISVDPLPARANWNSVGQVTRAQARRSVLEEIGRAAPPGCSLSEVRRQLRDKYPMELCRAIRAARELTGLKLIRSKSKRKQCKLYELTPAGRRVVELLRRQQRDNDDSASAR